MYTQQRNKCVVLLRNTKKNYYENLDEKEVTDNKKFWRTIKPYLSDKSVKSDKIHLNENGNLIKGESETVEVLNNFFSNIVKKLKIPEYENLNSIIENIKDPVFRAILNYKNHSSIIAINKTSKNSKFSFHEVNNEKIAKEIRRLNKNRPLKSLTFPLELLKKTPILLLNFYAKQ